MTRQSKSTISHGRSRGRVLKWGSGGPAQSVWQQLKIADVSWQAAAARHWLAEFKPDIVHALRIQNEGYVAAASGYRPRLVSVWGSDFIFFAKRYPLHRLLTSWAVRHMDALTADCRRDIRLAREQGLTSRAPTQVFPGNGGVDLATYQPGEPAASRQPLFVYARGMGPYARLDTLLQAIQQLVKQPGIGAIAPKFLLLIQSALIETVCKDVPEQLLASGQVCVEPFVGEPEWVALLQRALAVVSPLVTDGTPNSMLEAMACGALPVMSRLESTSEWIKDGQNGLLFDATDPVELAQCMRLALDNRNMLEAAQVLNHQLVVAQADYAVTMPRIRDFYQQVIADSRFH